MRRAWGLALMVAVGGHAIVLAGMARVGFGECEESVAGGGVDGVVMLMEEGRVEGPAGVTAEPRAVEIASGVERVEAREVMAAGGGSERLDAAVRVWSGRVEGAGLAGREMMDRAREGADGRARLGEEWLRAGVEWIREARGESRTVLAEFSSLVTSFKGRRAGTAAGAEDGTRAAESTSGGHTEMAGMRGGDGALAAGDAGTGAVGPGVGPVAAGGNRAPEYPPEALRRRLEGVVVVRVDVDGVGGVVAARVLESSGAAMLDGSALEAVRGWRFEPGRDGWGRAVSSRADVPVEFRIRESGGRR